MGGVGRREAGKRLLSAGLARFLRLQSPGGRRRRGRGARAPARRGPHPSGCQLSIHSRDRIRGRCRYGGGRVDRRRPNNGLRPPPCGAVRGPGAPSGNGVALGTVPLGDGRPVRRRRRRHRNARGSPVGPPVPAPDTAGAGLAGERRTAGKGWRSFSGGFQDDRSQSLTV